LRTSARYVLDASAHDPACVAFFPQDARMPFDYYARGARDAGSLTPVFPNAPWSAVKPFVEQYLVPSGETLDRLAASCPTLWLIASHQGLRDGPTSSRTDYFHYHALLRSLALRYPTQRGTKFGYAAVIWVTRFSR
jgi:hypothetical protein